MQKTIILWYEIPEAILANLPSSVFDRLYSSNKNVDTSSLKWEGRLTLTRFEFGIFKRCFEKYIPAGYIYILKEYPDNSVSFKVRKKEPLNNAT